jgi:cytoskeleton protein RodZ
MDEKNTITESQPGAELALIREKKGLTKEYVASKLHLRVKLIELLEEDNYDQMPEPVFIKGYLRAYAKLLSVSPEPYIATFNNIYKSEKKLEKTLWQSKRESNRGELVVRIITTMVAVSALVAIVFWWQNNKQEHVVSKDNQELKTTTLGSVQSNTLPKTEGTVAPLTPLSKMQSMFSSQSKETSSEKAGA